MDTPNVTTTTTATADLLKQWWDAKTFDGKEFCTMNDAGALSVTPFNEKIVSTLNHITGDAVIQSLTDKYKELERQASELEKEWNESSDKIKLLSKIGRIKDYISQSNAIGNFEALLQPLKKYEDEINALVEENYKAKQALVAEAETFTVENNNWKDLTQKFRDLTDRWKSLGFVDKKRNEALWEKLEAIKGKFFEDKRLHQEDIGNEMLQNLDLKMEIVEKAEANAQSENWRETTEVYKQLLEEWKNTGRTMPEKNEALWQRFIAAKNNFFDRKKIHTDQIKVEQEANYIKKLEIIEKAETIQNSTDWAITAKAFTELMDEWKAVGQIPSEYGNVLWDRFSAAKELFYNAKRARANEYKIILDENLAKKNTIIDRAEAIKNSSNWREVTEEMNQLFEQWKQIGNVGKEHNDTLWTKFASARKHFYSRKDEDRDRKKQMYEKNKEVHNIQTRNFLNTLMSETHDDELQIKEFTEGIQNITDGPKAEELRQHLKNLIVEIEQRLKNRAVKIADIRGQVAKADQSENVSPAASENIETTEA